MISVLIPARRMSADLEECIQSVKKQTKKCGEIIVVLDEIKDATKLKKYGVKYVLDKGRTIGSAYATGVKIAKGDIIAFIDDDAVAPGDWLEKLAAEINKGADVIGGEDIIPNESSFFQKAAYQIDKARTLKKKISGRDASRRLRATNMACKKSIFKSENFNLNLKGLQEPEFLHRLYKNNMNLVFSPSIFVYHKRRSTLRGIFRQIYRNGKAKIDLIKFHNDMIYAEDTASIMLAALIGLFLADIIFWKTSFLYIFYGAAFLYLFVIMPFFVVLATREVKYYPHWLAINFTRIVAYTLGIIAGMPKFFTKCPKSGTRS